MKKLLLAVTLAATMFCTSCLGPNKNFNSLHEWNKTATKSDAGNEAIYIVLWIVPVYQIVYLGDAVIFNTVEYWQKTPAETASKD
jgi:hypothetical protein